jgi:hypothetical protein
MSSTRSFRVISGPSTLTGTVGCDASLAIGSIWSGTLKQDILQAGGTWPPDGTRTTSGHSATSATSQTKEDSGDLARRLIESSPGEQRQLWKELKREHQTQPTRFEQLSSATRRNLKRLKERRIYNGDGHLVRSEDELMEIEHLKARRRTLLFEIAEGWYKTNRKRKNEELMQIAGALYDLTQDETYLL